MPPCRQITSHRGVNDRASPGSPGRGSGRRWRRRPAVRGRDRTGPALPPGDHRPGGSDAGRDVPRPVVDRTRHGRSIERTHHRRRLAAQGCPQPAPLECVAVIRALLAGEEVSHDGLVRVDRARLYTLPAEAPPLIGAAVSEATAQIVGSWADGLITVSQRPESTPSCAGCLRRGRWCGQAALSPSTRVVGGQRRRGGGDRARAVADQRVQSPGLLGPGNDGPLRRGVPPRTARGHARLRVDLIGSGAAARSAGRAGGARVRRRLDPPRRQATGAIHRHVRRTRRAGPAGGPTAWARAVGEQ